MSLVYCLADVYNQAQRIAPEREDQRLSLNIPLWQYVKQQNRPGPNQKITMQNIPCKVENIEALTKNVSRITLIPSQTVKFNPGQYLRVILAENDKRPFSIANAPREDGRLELHIGAEPGNKYAGEVLQCIRDKEKITIDGGHGKAFLHRETLKPIVLVAGGTGYSYTSAILQQLLTSPLKEPVFLYWGGRNIDDLYAYQELCKLDKKYSRFRFIPVVENPPTNWQGKTGWVHKAVLADFVSLAPYQVYIAGRFEMAGVAREEFHQQGLLLKNLYGDAFEFI
jgi:aquacobalamin reductase/NAD(P)H-flavin reductase